MKKTWALTCLQVGQSRSCFGLTYSYIVEKRTSFFSQVQGVIRKQVRIPPHPVNQIANFFGPSDFLNNFLQFLFDQTKEVHLFISLKTNYICMNILIEKNLLWTFAKYLVFKLFSSSPRFQMNENGNFENLPELHSLTCGLKALVTQAIIIFI